MRTPFFGFVRFVAIIALLGAGLASAVGAQDVAGPIDKPEMVREPAAVTAADLSAAEDYSPGLSDLLLAAVQDGPQVVVVTLDVPEVFAPDAVAEDADAVSAIEEAQAAVVADTRASSVGILHRFKHVPAMTVRVQNEADIDALLGAPGVLRIDLDLAGTGHLAQTVPLTNTDDRHTAGNDGDGVVVAVLDTGIDSDHPDLVADVIGAGQRCFGFNSSAAGVGFCPDGSDSQTGAGAAEDDAGHGTHVSGIISSDGIVSSPGFAPGAEVLALKVLDDCSFSGCFSSFSMNIVAALDYIIDNPALGVDVINISVGTDTRFSGHCDSNLPAAATAVNTLRNAGVLVFASAGNDSDAAGMSAPACLSNVVSVGNSDDFNDPAPSTNVSPTTDIFGPGVTVESDGIGGGLFTATGTSMSSPSAAGCAALLIGSGDATTPLAVETRLKTSSVSVTAANGLTYPRFDCGLGVSPGCPASSTMTVSHESGLAAAINCYNTAGSLTPTTTVTLRSDIALTGNLPNINNDLLGQTPRLVIEGSGHTLDAAGNADPFHIIAGDLTVNALTITGSGDDAIEIQRGALTVTNSTITANAWGIYRQNSFPSTISVSNSTFTDQTNQAYLDLGAGSGAVTIVNSTFVDNTVGISAASQATLSGSLVARNTTNCSGGNVVNGGGNVSETVCGPIAATPSVTATLDASLATNGCASTPCTETIALQTGSPATDAAGTCGLSEDQRGLPRPPGACDAGAFELSCPSAFSVFNESDLAIAFGCYNGALANSTTEIVFEAPVTLTKPLPFINNSTSGARAKLIIEGSGHGIDAAGNGDPIRITDGDVDIGQLTISGGGSAIYAAEGFLSVTGSTLTGNNVGIFLPAPSAFANVSNTTISDNSMDGFFVLGGASLPILSGVTITDNTGYGIRSFGITAITNTLLARNGIGDCEGVLIGGAIVGGAGSVSQTGCGPVVATPGLGTTLAPGLEANGCDGPCTATIALNEGSPAINAAGACGAGTDQRGLPRPVGAACDAGAYELGPDSLTVVSPPCLAFDSEELAPTPPVAQWVADDWAGGTNNWVDRVGGKIATVPGAANSPTKTIGAIVGGQASSGLVFDGVDDHLLVAPGENPIQGATSVTIAAFFSSTQGASGSDSFFWRYPGPLNGEAPSFPNDWGLTYNAAGEASGFFNDAFAPVGAPVSLIDGTPHTMILTWQDPTDFPGEGVARLYVDGVLFGQSPFPFDGGNGIDNTNGFVIGSERETLGRFFSGPIGELRFYDTIEDATTIHAEMAGLPLTPGTPKTVHLTGSTACVPAGASSVVLTVTSVEPTGPGNLRLSAAGVAPAGGVVTYIPNGLNNSNTVTVPLSAAGAIDLAANNSATHVRLTVVGYYSRQGTLEYFPLAPCAVADSRTGQSPAGSFIGPFAAGAAYPDVDVVGSFSTIQGGGNTDCGVAEGADAVLVNAVAIGPAGGSGGLALGPGGSDPFENTTNFAPISLNNAAASVVPVDSAGRLALNITGAGQTHVRLVVLGYFTTSGGDPYTPVNPCAAFDSRIGIPDDTNPPTGTFAGKREGGNANVGTSPGTTTYNVTGSIPSAQGGELGCAVPEGASAVLMNLVAIQPEAAGNFRAYATGSSPTGGVLNFNALSPPLNNSNAVVVPLDAGGNLDLFVNAPSKVGLQTVHARGVILGYYE